MRRPEAAELPPVYYSGSLRSEARVVDRSSGQRTVQMTRSLRVGGDSYLWQPWFATTSATLELSQAETHAVVDTKNTFASGDGRVLLFPRSRFPLQVFVNVADSRTDLGNTLDRSGDFRRTRAGFVQRYRSVTGDADYTAGYEHVVEDSFGDRETSDRLRLQMNRRMDAHEFVATTDVERTRREQAQKALDAVFVGRHSFRPDAQLSVESAATLTSFSTESPRGSLARRSALLTSSASWRPDDRKWRLTGNARSSVTQVDSGRGGSSVSHLQSASVAGTYEITDDLRASGSLSGSVAGSEDDNRFSSSQTATLSYSPRGFDLGGFVYSWSTTASASNRYSSVDGSVPTVGATAGHSLNRAYPLSDDGAWVLSTTLSQNAGTNASSRDGASHNLNHSASSVLTRSEGNDLSSLRLSASDTRGFGRREFSLQSVSLQGSHVATLSRHASWQASFTSQYVRQQSGSRESSGFPASSLALAYRHGRLLDVSRLRFSTELRASANSLLPLAPGDEQDSRITWDNRLDYRIGRLELRLRGTLTERSGNRDASVFLSVTRSFDGVF